MTIEQRPQLYSPACWLVKGQPNWDAIARDVLCSRCGYDLRMLVEPQCPECGLTFSWEDLFYRISTRNDRLFEHNWRRLRTMLEV